MSVSALSSLCSSKYLNAFVGVGVTCRNCIGGRRKNTKSSCIFRRYQSSSEVLNISKQLLFLCVCLSSSIYIFSLESVNTELLDCVHEYFVFQQTMDKVFSSGVIIGTLHNLIYLPRQVKNVGPLPVTSAFCFENVNRFLKISVTGKIRQGIQIAERFLLMQTVLYLSTGHLLQSTRYWKFKWSPAALLAKWTECAVYIASVESGSRRKSFSFLQIWVKITHGFVLCFYCRW